MTAPEAIAELVMFDPDYSYHVQEYHMSTLVSDERIAGHEWSVVALRQAPKLSLSSGFHAELDSAVEVVKCRIERQNAQHLLAKVMAGT